MRAGWRLALALGLAGAIPAASNAQLGLLLGNPNGTYCKIKGNEIIARSQLRVGEGFFVLEMTMRRIASLARSKGFAGFVVTKQTCEVMLMRGTPISRSCKLTARMEASAEPPAGAPEAGKWFGVDTVLRNTQAESASYPVPTGMLNKGNACVID